MKNILILCALVSLLATGCAPSATEAPTPNETITVTGSATYRARIAMPSEAVLTVLIEDVSIADKPAAVLAETKEIFGDRQVPIAFSLSIPKSAINPNAHYALRANIKIGEQLKFATDTNIPALTHNALDKFDLLLPIVKSSTAITPSQWRGEFVYLADAANFTDCATGARWPVANEGDYLAAEKGYLAARSAPSKALVVNFEGHIESRPAMEGPARDHMIIDRLGDFELGATCNAKTAGVTLEDTTWNLIEIGGKPIANGQELGRAAQIKLDSKALQVSGSGGCNNTAGSYETSGDMLKFGQMMGTLMACEQALMEQESDFNQMLQATTHYRIEGNRLTLLAGTKALAIFGAK